MGERVGATELRGAFSEAALDRHSDAIFLVDAGGRPLLMNRQARALVARQEALVLTRVGLRARRAAGGRALAETMADVCGAGASGGALSLTRSTGPPLRVLVTPVRVEDVTLAMLVVDDPARPDPQQVENLRGYYGLSSAEAETAVALARGLSPQQVAALRGVSMTTIRTQIRHALRKAEARGIPELVALVASAPSRAP